jgi:hypothetical protein
MERNAEQIRSLRLHAHHLDRKLPFTGIKEAAGACGLQNSPPGAWETALFNRLEGCTPEMLRKALWEEKSLLQAWSCRGAPMVFPAEEEGVFLTPLAALPGEEPWIYTRGIQLVLDHLGMSFHDLLPLVERAVGQLDHCVIKSKESLDRILAERVREWLPPEKRRLWRTHPCTAARTGRRWERPRCPFSCDPVPFTPWWYLAGGRGRVPPLPLSGIGWGGNRRKPRTETVGWWRSSSAVMGLLPRRLWESGWGVPPPPAGRQAVENR